MTSATIDHMVSLTVFIAAILIFIGLFSQSMETGLTYQRHSTLSTKTSDLLDTILLNPGLPANWGQTDNASLGFGLQDPAYSQYIISSFSTMRLSSSTQPLVYYPRTNAYFSNLTAGFGGYLHSPTAKIINGSVASKLLGINGTYGFQFSLSPTLTVIIQKVSVGSPLKLSVSVEGTGFPLANSPLSYNLITVNQDSNNYPSYTVAAGTSVTDSVGSTQLSFQGINGDSQSYALIVYSYLNGLEGMGYYVNIPQSFNKTIVPLIDSFANRSILLAHGDSLGQQPSTPSVSQLSYNATFVILNEDYTLRQVQLNQFSATGELIYGSGLGLDYAYLNVPNIDGILIVTYKSSAGQYGLVLMPWGLGSLAFPLTFGGNPAGRDWIATDIRQVNVGGISYQARLGLWELTYGGSS
jgi:hypothetical protein